MQDDINDLIEQNVGLVYYQLKRFHLVDNQDAESDGYEALYKAALTFDKDRNITFSTYASVCIYNTLGSFVRTLKKQRQLEVLSYNNIIPSAEDDTEFLDLLASEQSTESVVLNAELKSKVLAAYALSFNRLTNSNHRKIVACWKESGFVASTVEIAKNVGVSQSYVSQVINKFKVSLKKKVEDYYYA